MAEPHMTIFALVLTSAEPACRVQAITSATGVPSSTVLLTVHSESCERRTAPGSSSRAASPPSPSGNRTRNVTSMSCQPAAKPVADLLRAHLDGELRGLRPP